MVLLLTILSCLLALLFVGALTLLVRKIVHVLEAIGSANQGQSSLEMITWGVRAIEIETRHIPTQVTQLNGGLSAVAERLKQIDDGLVAIAGTATNQPRYR
jgi:hypothetical protein